MAATTTLSKQKITTRFAGKSCGCGCKGTDPWHRLTFVRTIRNVRDEQGSCPVRGFFAYSVGGERPRVEYDRIGEARFPWGVEVVVETVYVYEDRRIVTGWHIRDDC